VRALISRRTPSLCTLHNVDVWGTGAFCPTTLPSNPYNYPPWGYKQATTKAYSEEDIQKAITSWKNKEFRSFRATAIYFRVLVQILRARMAERKTKTAAHEEAQLLSNAEEKTLERWITRLTSTGYLATLALVIETVEQIRQGRVELASSPSTKLTQLPPIGHECLYRFLNRYLILKGTYSRQLEFARH
jgi:hypothetical protein